MENIKYLNGDELANVLRARFKNRETITHDEIEAVRDELMKKGIKSCPPYGYGVSEYDLSTLGEIKAINPENPQNIVWVVGDADLETDQRKEMELTRTTSYHDWNNTALDNLLKAIEKIAMIEEAYDTDVYEVDAERVKDEISEVNKYGADIPTTGKISISQIYEKL